MMHPYRSHTCGDLRVSDVDSEVRLSGWLHNRRDLGGVLFIDLRDNHGLVQLVARPGSPAFDELSHLPKETVIRVDGRVLARDEANVNPEIASGEIEVEVATLEVLGRCDPLPFSVFPEEKVSEETRLRYRFLDLRRQRMHRNILLRSAVIAAIRQKMTARGFFDLQTPILSATSPEGARDFLVPSRLHPGKFYALPQAPQQFKQLLMISGFDRYFQIAPCFRDEDSRADRSPGEFYQLDIEMSFVEQEDVFAVIEDVMTELFTEFAPDRTTIAPFPRIAYRDALARYGTDKPDLRAKLELVEVSHLFEGSDFRAFANKHVRAMPVHDCADKPRSFYDQLGAFAIEHGAAGLAWIKIGDNGELTGPIAKFLTPDVAKELIAAVDGKPGTAVFFGAGAEDEVARIMSEVRVEAAKRAGLFEENVFRFAWIVDFPMYEKADDGTIEFSHNPFSMPQGGLDALRTQQPLEILAWQYDIVCNGVELSSGAVRNHDPEIMYEAFRIAGYSKEHVDAEFGGMVRALHYGAPPHAGVAPGVDRIVMLLADEPNIRETIAFPLNQNAQDLLMGAPSEVEPQRLRELHLTPRPCAETNG
ncbi:aspartate--tRNA ligase [Nocardia amamiensis]|uniref:aspartate--tRNA ligase n=1 Tax=Nocardia amamiensis TaxID=404578 RepID=UPI000A76C34F|nr:aspartate--tRNA ligase [Nocardia amamiensis]